MAGVLVVSRVIIRIVASMLRVITVLSRLNMFRMLRMLRLLRMLRMLRMTAMARMLRILRMLRVMRVWIAHSIADPIRWPGWKYRMNLEPAGDPSFYVTPSVPVDSRALPAPVRT